MKSTRRMVFVIIFAVFFACPLAGATAGMSRGFEGSVGKGQGLIGMKTFLELKLTPAQQEEMLDILSRSEREEEALRAEAGQAMRKLTLIMRAENFDETALRQAYREVSSAREEMMVFRGRIMQELKGLLTPEQTEIVDRMKMERREKRRDRIRSWKQADTE